MGKFEQINEYLEEYEDLWQEIGSSDSVLPCLDITMDIINENNYYGCDFSGKQQVYRLFHTGASNYFPGICNVNKIESIDKRPIYIFDIASDNRCEYVGNFKYYMTTLLKDYLSKNPKKKYRKYALEALAILDHFSNIVHNKKYILVRNFD